MGRAAGDHRLAAHHDQSPSALGGQCRLAVAAVMFLAAYAVPILLRSRRARGFVFELVTWATWHCSSWTRVPEHPRRT